MEIILWSAVLLASLAVLLKGAEVFVSKAALVALNLGISYTVIGITLVALGTSLPELAAGAASVFKGAGEFVAGTVVGSNTANICFILGITAIVFGKFKLSGHIMRRDAPVMAVAAVILSLITVNGVIGRIEGLILFLLYPTYLVFASGGPGERPDKSGRLKKRTITYLVLSAAAIFIGAEFTVRSVVRLTEILGLADTSILALTVVAIGSSLPELVVSMAAAKKGFFDMCLGNVVGSNICNSLLVVGAPALISPLPASRILIEIGLPFMLAATFILPVVSIGGSFGRISGTFMLALFAGFIAALSLALQ